MNKVVLFDMDGTLTPARKPMEENVLESLKNLSNYAKIGIVTGSGFDYVKQQCQLLFKQLPEEILNRITIMPCNGTQVYKHIDGEWQQTFALDMRKELGEEFFKQLMLTLCQTQSMIAIGFHSKLTYSGHFISYRGSMINWCPIGRLAGNEDRDNFKIVDKEHKIREKVLETFVASSDLSEKLSFSLGGNTSIDIYPNGWDKTYALKHFPNHDAIFIGDRCTDPNGNDKSIYDKLKSVSEDSAYETTSTGQTIEIINNIIENIK